MSLERPTWYDWFLGACCGGGLLIIEMLADDLPTVVRLFVWWLVGVFIVVYPKSSEQQRQEKGERFLSNLKNTFRPRK